MARASKAKVTRPGAPASEDGRGRRPSGGRTPKNGRGGGRGSGGRRGGGKRGGDRKRGGLLRGLITLCAILMVWGAIGVCGFLIYAGRDLPDVSTLRALERSPSATYLDRHGALIGRRGDQQGRAMRLSELPPYLPAAVLAVEDRKFYLHPGVDPFGVARAAYANWRAGEVVQGGSTITQQLAKNLFLSNERTFRRKSQEVVLALWLERKFTKDEILELYLNRVYFGAGAWGVEAASRRYFGKSASETTLGEAALLAGLLKAPSRYNPASNVARAEGRATVVLDVMVEAGRITPDEREAAFDAPIVVARAAAASSAHYVMDWLDVELDTLLGRLDRDVVVETTLDLGLQRAAQAALANALTEEVRASGAEEGAALALAPDGGVLAMAGGRSYDVSQFNRATQARRQPGSAFKSFVYLAAVEAGARPNDVWPDAPVSWGDYSPSNYNNRYEGEITLRRAFATSSNSVAVRLAQSVGLDAVMNTAREAGITSPLRREAALALGAQEVTLLELAAAYAPFANGGEGVIAHGVTRVRTLDGEVLYERHGSGPGQVMDADSYYVMADLLRAVVATGTGRRAALPGRDVGGKTGTTDNFRDAWFVGFADGATGLVWVGNDRFRPMQDITGGTLPAEIWGQFMSAAPMFGVAAPTPAVLTPQDDPIAALLLTGEVPPEASQTQTVFTQPLAPAPDPGPAPAPQPIPVPQAPAADDPLGALIARSLD